MDRVVLVLEPGQYSAEALGVYSQAGRVELCSGGLPQAPRPDVHVLVTRLAHHISASFLERFPNVRYVATPTTGLNHVDTACCAQRGIQVVSLKGQPAFLESIPATAELTWGLLLALTRRVPAAHRSVSEQASWNRDAVKGHDLRGKTLGIIGLGRIGRQVCNFAKVFGMKVLACDPHIPEDAFRRQGAARTELPALLGQSDAVSVHADLRPDNRGLLSQGQFAQIKPGAYLVNTARGELIDEGALLQALEARRLAGAALDVLSFEERGLDLGSHPLAAYARSHDNLIITPHMGGCTLESMQATEVFIARRVLEAMAGGKARGA